MGAQQCKTHIANAYDETIYCQTAADHRNVTLEDVNVSENIQIPKVGGIDLSQGTHRQYHWRYAEVNGYTAISPNSFLGFEPRADDGTVYITIYSASGKVICHSFPIAEDFSVIVKADGTITRTEYGHIWVDTEGNNHLH